jgi:hypothetical protein
MNNIQIVKQTFSFYFYALYVLECISLNLFTTSTISKDRISSLDFITLKENVKFRLNNIVCKEMNKCNSYISNLYEYIVCP